MPSECGGGRRPLRLALVFSCKRYQQGVRLTRRLEQAETQLQQWVVTYVSGWFSVGYLEYHIWLVWRGPVGFEGRAQYVAQPIDLQLLSVIGVFEQYCALPRARGEHDRQPNGVQCFRCK